MARTLTREHEAELECLKLKKQINENYHLAQKAASDAVERALLTGELLSQWKELLPHGRFEGFVEKHFEGSLRTAQLYMQAKKRAMALPKAQQTALLKGELSISRIIEFPKESPEKQPPKESISAKGKPGVAAPASSSSAPASSVPASEPVVHSEEAADVPLMKCPRCGRGAKEVSDSGYCGRIDCGTDEPSGERPNYGKCPNCAGTKWTEAEDGVTCSKCNQPHGEPAGEVDGDRIAIQRSKTVKTVEALMRAFDDLNVLLPKDWHGEVIAKCKSLLVDAKGWK